MSDATYVGAGMPCSNCGNPLTPSQPHKCGVKYSGSGPVIPMGPPENPYAPPPDWEPGQAFPQAWRYGAAEERARIVKLLRDEAQATTFPKTADALDLAADLIERSA